MSTESQPVTLTPSRQGVPRRLYCGVTREGFTAMAGDTANIADGEESTITCCIITVRRNGSQPNG